MIVLALKALKQFYTKKVKHRKFALLSHIVFVVVVVVATCFAEAHVKKLIFNFLNSFHLPYYWCSSVLVVLIRTEAEKNKESLHKIICWCQPTSGSHEKRLITALYGLEEKSSSS